MDWVDDELPDLTPRFLILDFDAAGQVVAQYPENGRNVPSSPKNQAGGRNDAERIVKVVNTFLAWGWKVIAVFPVRDSTRFHLAFEKR